MKKVTALILAALFINFSLVGCQPKYKKYTGSFFGSFDTHISVVAYSRTEKEFDRYFTNIENRFSKLHKLFDKYNSYEGINNIKTINDNAGIQPVKVDKEIIDLVLFAKEWHGKTGGRVNIAMGPVLEIWHQFREDAEFDPETAQLPPKDVLQKAAMHTDINKVIVDKNNSTVFLADKGMSLDVGAIAKGYATELVADELIADGFKSGILSPGGNIRTIGKPLDNIREKWGIGIQDPDKSIVVAEENILDTVYLNNASVVSSGDYQRYYVVDDKRIHHIIDPDTLMPADYFRAVTVITEDSGLADFLSTTVFLLPYEEGLALVNSLDGVEALWVMPDKSIKVTEGMKNIMRSYGATGGRAN